MILQNPTFCRSCKIKTCTVAEALLKCVFQVQHYVNTTFPLAVKLGTITPEGKADVFSYEEDDMVEDPNLANHLGHWGINVQNMQKVANKFIVNLYNYYNTDSPV